MPTRKQRRRQQKSRRHEWEYVYVDDEGREVEVDSEELKRPKDEPAKPKAKQQVDRRNGRSADRKQRPRRTPQPPSWRRAGKRAALLGALFVVVFAFGLGGKNKNPLGAVLIGLIYAVAFVPLQYFIDKVTYRAYLRRQAASKT
jgi:hypothetical protein